MSWGLLSENLLSGGLLSEGATVLGQRIWELATHSLSGGPLSKNLLSEGLRQAGNKTKELSSFVL